MMMIDRLLFLLDERVGNLLTAINRGDEHEQSSSRDNQAERAGGLVASIVCVGRLVRKERMERGNRWESGHIR